MDICKFWRDVLEQNAEALRGYFARDAMIRWHCTNERFTADEFITANCEYPGEWDGTVERVEEIGDLRIAVTHVYGKGGVPSFHVTSFIRLAGEKIASIDEYWAEDGDAPAWRTEMRIGRKILGE